MDEHTGSPSMEDNAREIELYDLVAYAWRKRRMRKLDSAWFDDTRFIEWIAREARAAIEDEPVTGIASRSDSKMLADSIRGGALAAKCKICRIPGTPAYQAPKLPGSVERVTNEAGRIGYAPCLDLSVAAGIGRELWDEESSSWVKLPSGIPRGSYVALKVSGESMLPLLHSGDVMVVRLDSPFLSGDIVVARLDDGGFVVKRVGRIGKDRLELLSINPSYSKIEVQRSVQPVVGTVVLCWCEHQSPPSSGK